MGFVFEDEALQPAAGGRFVFEDEIPQPTAREAEVAAHEEAGGGLLSSLERGLRRTGQTISASMGMPDEALQPGQPLSLAIPARFGREAKILEQEKAIQALPQHPTLTRMTRAAGGEESILDAIGAAGSEFIESPDKLQFAGETLAEQVPVLATFLAGTKGAGALMGGTQTLAKEAAALGAGGALSSVAATYGPNVAEGLQQGLEYDDAEARALKQSAAQAIVDGVTSGVLPFKIGLNQYMNVPAQALIQASGGAGGEMARSAVVGEEADMGDVVIEGMLELLGLPVEAVQAATLRADKPAPMAEAPAAPGMAPAPMAEAPVAPGMAPAPMAEAPVAPGMAPAPEVRVAERRIDETPIADEQRVAERRAFQSPAEVTATEFEVKAGELGLTDIQKEALAPVVDADPVTGFHPAKDRVPTVERAQAHVAETGEPAVYIETDIANLGGLNAELGHSGADKVFRGITDIFQAELDALPADSVKIRHGGDEFSAIVVNTDQQSVNEAMSRAQAKIADYIAEQGLADLPHTKAGAPSGVGIKYGTSEIVPGLTSEEIFSEADMQVELQKKQEKTYVTPKTTEETGPRPPERPAGEVAGPVATAAEPVAAKETVTTETIPDDLEITMDVETVETGETTQETFKAKELMKSIDDNIDSYTKLKKCLG